MASIMAPQKPKTITDNNKESVSILRKTRTKSNQSNSKLANNNEKLNFSQQSNNNNNNDNDNKSLNSAKLGAVKQSSYKINQQQKQLQAKQSSVSNLQSSSSTPTTGTVTTTKRPQKPRRRVATIAQRRAANIRERRRMFNLNAAFDKLRKKVPSFAYEKRLSRIETLKLAIMYIRFMDDLVNDDAYAEKYKKLTIETQHHNNSLICNFHNLTQPEPTDHNNNNNNNNNANNQHHHQQHSLNSQTSCTIANCPDFFPTAQTGSSYSSLYGFDHRSTNSNTRIGCLNRQEQQQAQTVNNIKDNKRYKQTHLDNRQTIKNEPTDCFEDCCSVNANNTNTNTSNLRQQYGLTKHEAPNLNGTRANNSFLSSATNQPSLLSKLSVTHCDSSLSSLTSSSSTASSPLSSSTFSMIDSTNSSPIGGTTRQQISSNQHNTIPTTNNPNSDFNTTTTTNLNDRHQQENFASPNNLSFAQAEQQQQQQQQYSSPLSYSGHFQDSISILPYYNNCEQTKYYNYNGARAENESSPLKHHQLTNDSLTSQCYSANSAIQQQNQHHSVEQRQSGIVLDQLNQNPSNQQLAILEVPASNSLGSYNYSLHSLQAR